MPAVTSSSTAGMARVLAASASALRAAVAGDASSSGTLALSASRLLHFQQQPRPQQESPQIPPIRRDERGQPEGQPCASSCRKDVGQGFCSSPLSTADQPPYRATGPTLPTRQPAAQPTVSPTAPSSPPDAGLRPPIKSASDPSNSPSLPLPWPAKPTPSAAAAAPSPPHSAAGLRPHARASSLHSPPIAPLSATTAAPYPALTAAVRGLQTAAASSPPGSDPTLEPLSLAALAAGLWDDGREGLTPAAIVEALDRHIVGQAAAKRAVAVALRNRWRRQRVEPAAFRDEIMPKNILMVGPTGCGKTEVARRLAKLADAPFVKVEATKYTELGYVGRDVDEIIKDLVEAALVLVRQRAKDRLAQHSARRAEAVILRALVGPLASDDTLETFREMYRRGEMDNTLVDIDASLLDGSGSGQGGSGSGSGGFGGKIDFGPGGVIVLDKLFSHPNRPFGGAPGGSAGGGAAGARGQGGKKTLKVSEARSRLEEAEKEKLLNSEQITREAVRAAEQDGIVFIDEIDKIVEPSSGRVVSGGVSSEGVQRDLLPIIEGSVVSTKHGNVSTEHILFICSGAFHSAKPSDMLAELQGRLPIRVELKGLTADDFHRILTEPENNMIRQQQELLATEGVSLVFTEGAVRAVSHLTEQANRQLDNIGARRLHTVLERVLADISFSAPERVVEARVEGKETYEYVVDEELVHRRLDDLLKKQDLSRYVL